MGRKRQKANVKPYKIVINDVAAPPVRAALSMPVPPMLPSIAIQPSYAPIKPDPIETLTANL